MTRRESECAKMQTRTLFNMYLQVLSRASTPYAAARTRKRRARLDVWANQFTPR